MQVYQNLNDFKRLNNAIVTSGTFDGVHIGHQKILKRLKEITEAVHGESVVITYWPHPRKILSDGENNPKILYTLNERIELLREYNIDHLIIIHFTKAFSEISSESFLKDILADTIGTRKLVIGYDHRFGRNREGSFEYLVENSGKYGFEVEEIPREDIDHLAISSSAIRSALSEGDLDGANKFLGKPFHLIGKVVHGNRLGRTIGFPTANLKVEDEDKIIPKDGVYAVEVVVEGEMKWGMMNIGFRPTVNGRAHTIEVNIFNFDKDIYEKSIQVNFIKYLREEAKFSGIEALKMQLERDREGAMKVFSARLGRSI